MKHRSQPAIILLFSTVMLFAFFPGCKKDNTDRYEELRKNVPDQYKAFVNPFGDGSIIGAAVNLAYDIVILYDGNGTRYAWYQDKRIQGVFNIKDPNGPFGVSFLDSVGAAMEFPVSNTQALVILFDLQGKTYTSFDYNKSQFSVANTAMPASIMANHANSSSAIDVFQGPFQATGFEAMAEYVKAFGGDTAWHVFEKGGTRYARYVYDTGTWGAITQFTTWGGNNNLFSAVGAASLIVLNGIRYNIFISKDGSKMGVWHLDGNVSVFEGPWTIN